MNHPDTPYPIFAAIDAKPKLLTREQEHHLAVRARAGDQRARGELVERNLRLVVKIAAGFTNRAPQVELLDLVSEGVLGLMRAIDKFDPDSGNKLSTYATWWITQAITRAVDRDGSVTMPADVRREVRAAEHYAIGQAPRDVSHDTVHGELSPAMRERIDRSDVAAARAANACASLDYSMATNDGQSVSLAARIADPNTPDPCDEVVARIDLEHDVATLTSVLDSIERDLVRQRFGLERAEPTPLAVFARGARMNTAEARRMERAAFAKMREAGSQSQTTPAPCRPALAVLDLLRNGRREPSPTRTGALALATTSTIG